MTEQIQQTTSQIQQVSGQIQEHTKQLELDAANIRSLAAAHQARIEDIENGKKS